MTYPTVFDENTLVNPFDQPSMEAMAAVPSSPEGVNHHGVGMLDEELIKAKQTEEENTDEPKEEPVENDEMVVLSEPDEPIREAAELSEVFNAIDSLENFKLLLKEAKGVSKEMVMSIENTHGDFITSNISIKQFTNAPSRTNLAKVEAACESRLSGLFTSALDAARRSISSLKSSIVGSTLENFDIEPSNLLNARKELLEQARKLESSYGRDVVMKIVSRNDNENALRSANLVDYIARDLDTKMKDSFLNGYYIWYSEIYRSTNYNNHVKQLKREIEVGIGETRRMMDAITRNVFDSYDNQNLYSSASSLCSYGDADFDPASPVGSFNQYSNNVRQRLMGRTEMRDIRDFIGAATFPNPFGGSKSLFTSLERQLKDLERQSEKINRTIHSEESIKAIRLLSTRIVTISAMFNALTMHASRYQAYYNKLFMSIKTSRIRLKGIEEALYAKHSVNK